MLLLHVSALYELHLQGAQRILIKLCVCYVISAELSEGRLPYFVYAFRWYYFVIYIPVHLDMCKSG
jgi:hypothetical protein